MDLTNLWIETPLAIVLLGWIVTLWRQYISTLKECTCRQQKLLDIADKTSENNKQLIEEMRSIKKYAEYGKYWVKQHKPTIDRCKNCDDYDSCIHPNLPRVD